MSDDFASILFPNDVPRPVSALAPQTQAEPTPAPIAARPSAGDDAAEVFDTEAQAGEDADYSGVFEKLDDLALSLRLDGQAERSSQLVAAQDAMFEDAIAWGTPPDTVRDIADALHGAAGTVSPMTADQISDLNAKAMRELADVPVADLDLARDLIRQMSSKIKNLPEQLDASGLGSDPAFVRLIVAEAKRRAASARR